MAKTDGWAVIRDGQLDISETSISEQGELNDVSVFSICVSLEDAIAL
jgi:hypothetical protein